MDFPKEIFLTVVIPFQILPEVYEAHLRLRREELIGARPYPSCN